MYRSIQKIYDMSQFAENPTKFINAEVCLYLEIIMAAYDEWRFTEFLEEILPVEDRKFLEENGLLPEIKERYFD